VKDTDDGNQVDGSDAGAVPATSTIRGEYQGIIEFSKSLRKYWEEDRLSEKVRTRGQEYNYTLKGDTVESNSRATKDNGGEPGSTDG